ncbi:MAG: ROK family protein [Armatimonadetes bacterium]|nr:ROK family protein [Armatimonadota bacterium]MDE2205920.1 ROK family protein [Armatimonadota bacterium]
MQARKGAEYVVGVDLGGTNVRAAVLDRTENTLGRQEMASDAKAGVERTVGQIAACIQGAVRSSGLALEQIGAIGMAVPGHIDSPAGVIRWAPNFGDNLGGSYAPYKNVPLRRLVEEALGVAMVMDNDANVAALGEFRFGAGRGTHHLVMFTLGTGVGGGVIIDGLVLRGATGGAAEIGHIIIADGVGGSANGAHGRLESLAGRDAIIERAALAMESGRETLLWEHVESTDALQIVLTPKAIDDAAEKGDAMAAEVMRETGHFVGLGIASMVNVFNPDVVVLGGQISNSEVLFQAAKRTARASAVGSLFGSARVVRAELGDNAGIMGAAELAWREVNA